MIVSSDKFLEFEGAPVYLENRSSTDDINGTFPDKIYIKTLTQTFGFEYEFLLHENKIYYKKIGTDKSQWALYLDTGLPFSKKNKISGVTSIVEINCDGDALYAFSKDGKLYRSYLKSITSYTAFDWVDYFGWPEKIQVYQNSSVENKKSWCVGSSRKDVEYYEDILGNQHNLGPLGVESIIMLCEDGQTLRYTDPAVPSDFSHLFKGPEDGNFIAENIAESSSTIFLISDTGKMYTRYVDFNSVGSNPMLYSYSYKPVYSFLTGDTTESNTTVWMLPNEPWYQQPEINKDCKITRYITIIQNGKGNAARELRVAGLNENGQTGYFSKALYDKEWVFIPADLNLSPDAFLHGLEKEPFESKKSYKGQLWINGVLEEGYDCQIDGFHFAEGPCYLNFPGKDFKVELYYSEIWTPFMRLEPGYEKEPVRYFVTLDFDEAALAQKRDKNLSGMFENKSLEMHQYKIEVYEDYFYLLLEKGKITYELYLTKDGIIHHNPKLDRNIDKKTKEIAGFIEKYANPRREIRRELKQEMKRNKNESKISSGLSSGINFGVQLAKLFNIDETNEKVGIITLYSGEIVSTNKTYYSEDNLLWKYYRDYAEQYVSLKQDHPEFEVQKALKEMGMSSLAGDVKIIDYSSIFTGFVVQNGSKYLVYEFKDGLEGFYDAYHKYMRHGDFTAKAKYVPLLSDSKGFFSKKVKIHWDGKELKIK